MGFSPWLAARAWLQRWNCGPPAGRVSSSRRPSRFPTLTCLGQHSGATAGCRAPPFSGSLLGEKNPPGLSLRDGGLSLPGVIVLNDLSLFAKVALGFPGQRCRSQSVLQDTSTPHQEGHFAQWGEGDCHWEPSTRCLTCIVSVPLQHCPGRRRNYSPFTDKETRPNALLKVSLSTSSGQRACQDTPFHPKTHLRSASLDRARSHLNVTHLFLAIESRRPLGQWEVAGMEGKLVEHGHSFKLQVNLDPGSQNLAMHWPFGQQQ